MLYLDNEPYDIKTNPTKHEMLEWCEKIKQLPLFEKYEVWIWGSATNIIMDYGFNWNGDFDVAVRSKHFNLKEIAEFLHECSNVAIDIGFFVDLAYRVGEYKHILPYEFKGTTFVNLETNERFENLNYKKDRNKFLRTFEFELLIPYGNVTWGPFKPVSADVWWEHRIDNKKVHKLYGKDQILHNLWRSNARYPGLKWWKRCFGREEQIYHPPVNIKEL